MQGTSNLPTEPKSDVFHGSSESNVKDSGSFQQVTSIPVELENQSPRQLSNFKDDLPEGSPLDNYAFRLNADSNSHTPLLSTKMDEIPNNILDNLHQLEDLSDSTSLRNKDSKIDPVSHNEKLDHEETLQASEDDKMIAEPILELDQQLTPFQLLTKLREEYNAISVPNISHNMDFYYIDPDWYNAFKNADFDPETFTFDVIGSIKTKENEIPLKKSDKANFITFDQFKFLCDHFGLAENNVIIN